MIDNIRGAIYGALLGDAVGVPYEFTRAENIPPYEQIHPTPPAKFNRAWYGIHPGTYSDDGAQILCMIECFLTGRATRKDLHSILNDWLHDGHNSVDRHTFDSGNQTRAALGVSPDQVVELLNKEQYNGNGSLMRTLPVALFCDTPSLVISTAMELSQATHPHLHSTLCCAAYSLIVHHLLCGRSIDVVVDTAFADLHLHLPNHASAIDTIYGYRNHELRGSGWVVDSLWSAITAVEQSTSYQDAIRKSIAYGNDTDTTACIAGGLAGIIYGYDFLPPDWIGALRGREIIEPLVDDLINKTVRR